MKFNLNNILLLLIVLFFLYILFYNIFFINSSNLIEGLDCSKNSCKVLNEFMIKQT